MTDCGCASDKSSRIVTTPASVRVPICEAKGSSANSVPDFVRVVPFAVSSAELSLPSALASDTVTTVRALSCTDPSSVVVPNRPTLSGIAIFEASISVRTSIPCGSIT